MLSKSLIQFMLMSGTVFSLYILACSQTMVGLITVIVNSFKRAYARNVVFSTPYTTAGHCQPMPLPGTSEHSQASLAESLVGTLPLSPGSWCAQSFVCALQESVSPVLWKFCNQIPLASKVKFPGVGKSFMGLRTFLTV